MEVLTIGHSDHTIDGFVRLLRRHGVAKVVDVRSVPYSGVTKSFSPGTLERILRECGIGYLYLGKHLGGRPVGDKYYDDRDHVLYSVLSRTEFFQEGMAKLLETARESRTAVMCGEEDPSDCHRHRLIGRVLGERGVRVLHIRGNGSLQTAEDTPGFRGAEASSAVFGETGEWRSAYPVKRGDKA